MSNFKKTTILLTVLGLSFSSAEYLMTYKVSPEIFNSSIVEEIIDPSPAELTKEQFDFINSNIGDRADWTKCYDSKIDGHDIALFHQKCDSFSHTLTIITDKDSGKTVAGYSGGHSWSGSGWIVSNTPRLFRLVEGSNSVHYPHYTQFSMYRHSGYGPTFGGGHDIVIRETATISYCHGHSYSGFHRSFCHSNSNNVYRIMPDWVVYSVE